MTGTLINAITVLIGGTLGTFSPSLPAARRRLCLPAWVSLPGYRRATAWRRATADRARQSVSRRAGGRGPAAGEPAGAVGAWLQARLSRGQTGSSARFVEAFVTASIVFCVGPMTIQGAIDDGLRGDYTLLAIKALLDGFGALAFAATLGGGVLASILVILGFQGGLSLLASLGSDVFTPDMIAEMTAVGGVVLLSIGLRLLQVKQIRSANLLPALFIAPAIVALLSALGIAYYPDL